MTSLVEKHYTYWYFWTYSGLLGTMSSNLLHKNALIVRKTPLLVGELEIFQHISEVNLKREQSASDEEENELLFH